MNANVKAFLDRVKVDPDLSAKLASMDKDELIVAAKELGFELSDEDFQLPTGEVGDSDLGNVAGGAGLCILLGGAGGHDSADGETYGCACIAYGQGGDGFIGSANCVCFVGGVGNDGQSWFSTHDHCGCPSSK